MTHTSAAAHDAHPPEESTQGRPDPQEQRKLSTEQQADIVTLRARDAAVKAHEAAHAGAGGGLAGSPSYSYQTGPDGKQYAVGGEVSIDLSGGASPEATIGRMRQVRAAALAPANPSGQDRAVAMAASAREAAARAEIAQEAQEAEGSESEGVHAHDGSVCAQCAGRVDQYVANGAEAPVSSRPAS